MPTCGNKVKFKKQPDRQCTYNVTFRDVRVIVVVVGKQWVLHILRVCVFVALGIQRAMRMRHIVLSSEACPVEFL